MGVGSISEDARGIAVGEGSGDDGRGTDVESVQNTRRQQFIEKLPRPRRTSPRISSPVLHVNSSYEVQLAITSNSARLVPRDFSSECKPANSYDPAPAKPGCAGNFFFPKRYTGQQMWGLVTVVGSARKARRRGFSEEFSRNQKGRNHEYLFGDKSFNRIKPYIPSFPSFSSNPFTAFLSFFLSPHILCFHPALRIQLTIPSPRFSSLLFSSPPFSHPNL